MSGKTEEEVFLSNLYSVISEVDNSIQGVAYNFTSDEDFLKSSCIQEMQIIYWGEMIQRLHICCATTLLRLKKWFEAMEAGYQANNYYGFSSATRGLIEASADSFYTLGEVILPIAAGFKHIKLALCGEATKIIVSESLENHLIHYTFGRKLTSDEKKTAHPAHNAKQVTEYLRSIGKTEVIEVYAELCQISHPSTLSLFPFLLQVDVQHVALHKNNFDKELNKNFLERHKKTIYDTVVYAMTTSLCGLKIINYFDVPYIENIRTQDGAFKSLEGYSLWNTIEADIQKSLIG